MSTKKKPAAKKTAPKKMTKAEKEEFERKRALRGEIKGFIMLFVALFVFYCIFSSSAGKIGAFISGLVLRLFGTAGRYVFAAVIALSGAFLLFKKRNPAIFTGVVGINALIASGFPNSSFALYAFKEVQLYKDLWSMDTSGGFIGTLLAKLLKDLFSYTGAWLVIIFATIIAFIIIFRKSFVSTVKEEAERERELIEARKREKLTATLEEEDKKKYIDIDKARTVLETSDGDKLILVESPKVKCRKGRGGGKITVSEGEALNRIKLTSDEGENFGARNDENGEALNLSGSQSRITNRLYKNKLKPEPAKPSKLDEAAGEPEPANNAPETAPRAGDFTASGDSAAPLTAHSESSYTFPPVSLLEPSRARTGSAEKKESYADAAHLIKTLGDFGVEATVSDISIGPTITRFELQLQPGTRVNKIVSLQDDIALALAAQSVRMEAPIPGKSAVGIEIPNHNISMVKLSQVITAKEFTGHKSPLAAVLGMTLTGQPLVMDICAMPHVLIAGATGSGKSVCINTIITSILYHSSPEDVKMILIDPKMVELNVYNEIPHLLIPVVTDPKHAAGALGWAVREMTARYERFAENRVKDIDGYNKKVLLSGEEKMPRIMLIIDELSDLMMVAKQQVEQSICRLAQLARAAGIHIVLATQRPSVDVITGLIKANIPSRISFAVSSQIDSRTIIDTAGAEKLLGKGDMLYYPQNFDKPLRAQGAFINEEEIDRIVEFVKKKQTAEYDDGVMNEIKASAEETGGAQSGASLNAPGSGDSDDDLIVQAMEIAFEKGSISTSAIQRRLRLGYARAGRIVDEMEERGLISEADGARPRRVLVGRDEFYNMTGGKE